MPDRKSGRTNRRKIRFAIAGLGWFAQVAVLPAFRHASSEAELVALFSDQPEKQRKLGRSTGSPRSLADVRIIRALYRSARTGRPITLSPFQKKRRPTLRQEMYRPPVPHRELVAVDETSPN